MGLKDKQYAKSILFIIANESIKYHDPSVFLIDTV